MRRMRTPYHQTVRGQYFSSVIDGKKVKGITEREDGVDPNSKTETYAAISSS